MSDNYIMCHNPKKTTMKHLWDVSSIDWWREGENNVDLKTGVDLTPSRPVVKIQNRYSNSFYPLLWLELAIILVVEINTFLQVSESNASYLCCTWKILVWEKLTFKTSLDFWFFLYCSSVYVIIWLTWFTLAN